MKTIISITDFSFEFKSYGMYQVTYTHPATGEKWQTIIRDMTLIDCTLKNEDDPKTSDLEKLKKLCKNS